MLLPRELVTAVANQLRVVVPLMLVQRLHAGAALAGTSSIWCLCAHEGQCGALCTCDELKRFSQPMHGNRPSPDMAARFLSASPGPRIAQPATSLLGPYQLGFGATVGAKF